MRSRNRYLLVPLAAALLLAGCGGEDEGVTTPQPAAPPPAAPADIEVTGTDDLQFQPSDVEAVAGTIEVALTAEASAPHTFTVEAEGGDQTVVDAGPGQTASGSIDLEAGEYTFYCEVPGHREAGMEGTLTVA